MYLSFFYILYCSLLLIKEKIIKIVPICTISSENTVISILDQIIVEIIFNYRQLRFLASRSQSFPPYPSDYLFYHEENSLFFELHQGLQ